MPIRYTGVCEACHRYSSRMLPAPGTPDAARLQALYCPECHTTGRAVYPPPNLMYRDVVVTGLTWGACTFLAGFVLGLIACR